MPSCRCSMPMVKRMAPDCPSMPMVDIMKPMPIAMKPLRRLPSASVMVAVSANSISANFSDGPNFRAMAATGSVRKIRKTMPNMPPTNEAQAEMARASPARPCLAIGYPSKQATMAEASPGVLIMIDAREPPNMAP